MRFIILQILNSMLSFTINYHVPEPYMDEEFHLDQMQHYLDHDFTYWNPKLTTPPILYLLNLLPITLLSYISSNTLILCRLLNTFVYSNISYYLFYKCTQNSDKTLLFLILPTIYFYNFLFYTDTLSLTLLIIAYYSLNKGHRFISGLFAFLSIGCRQINIIWCVYICVRKIVIAYLDDFINRNKAKFDYKDPRLSMMFYIQAYSYIVINQFGNLLKFYKYHIIVVLSFIGFVGYNKGIVLGDRNNHQLVFHGVQMLYFSVCILIYLPFNYKGQLKYIQITGQRLKQSRNAQTILILLIGLCYLLIKYSTYVHPFILSDNRHYVFYVYKKIIQKFGNYLSILYALILIFLTRIMIQQREQTFQYIILMIFVFLSIAFSTLIEPRYFTGGILYFYLNMTNKEKLAINISIYILINIILIAVFSLYQFNCDFNQCRFMF